MTKLNAALILLSSVLSGLSLGLVDRLNDEPRVVGRGCDGASGPLYAVEEDHLPLCLVVLKR